MRKFIVAVLAAGCIGCTSPLAPEFTCKTQPRMYVLTNGTTQWEVDTYTQSTPCPAVPID